VAQRVHLRDALLPLRTSRAAQHVVVGAVHYRIPVIVRPDDSDTWLSSEAGPDELTALLAPFPAEHMRGYAVGLDVNRPAVDEPHLVAPL
jgi:putative SOS response-associated peptidase YedK